MSVTHKWIVIEDIGKPLTPIGFGLNSPIRKPAKFPIHTIARLLTQSRVTRMFEVYEKDHTMRVPLNYQNHAQSFEEIWTELNPGKEFPWARTVVEVGDIATTPATETPVATPVVETPAVATPAVETPVTPVVENPVVETPAETTAPVVETPVVEVPATEVAAPVVETPVVETPTETAPATEEASAPVVETPAEEVAAPVAETPVAEETAPVAEETQEQVATEEAPAETEEPTMSAQSLPRQQKNRYNGKR